MRPRSHKPYPLPIPAGAGTRPFESSGSEYRGAHAGAFTTFWNVHKGAGAADPYFDPPSPADFGMLLNFVGGCVDGWTGRYGSHVHVQSW